MKGEVMNVLFGLLLFIPVSLIGHFAGMSETYEKIGLD